MSCRDVPFLKQHYNHFMSFRRPYTLKGLGSISNTCQVSGLIQEGGVELVELKNNLCFVNVEALKLTK